MRILIVYGTTEGQTRKIATFIAERLRLQSHDVTLIDAAKPRAALDLTEFDAALIAARVHAGRHHAAVVRFVERYRAALASLPTAFVSVSMSAAGEDPDNAGRATRYATDFFVRTGWTPDRLLCAAGARLYLKYGPFGRWLLGMIDRHRYDTGRNYEFTDWPALGRFADGWIAAGDFGRQATSSGVGAG